MSWLPAKNKTFEEQVEAAAARTAARKARGALCSYWYNDQRIINTTPEERGTIDYLLKLNEVRRTIANFVRIVVGRDILVRFSTGQQSYASTHDGVEHIVISATTDPEKIDSTSGLALHEASHLKWSRYSPKIENSVPLFAWLRRFVTSPQMFVPDDITALATKLGLSINDIMSDMKFIINVMEDRRIDWMMWEAAPGWRGYYEALYDEYWHTPKVAAMLAQPYTHQQFVQFYRFRIVNMINPAADPKALPGLQEIYDLINLPQIKRFGKDPKWQSWSTKSEAHPVHSFIYPEQTLPDMIQTGLNILRVIYANSVAPGESEPQEGEGEGKKGGKVKWQKGMKLKYDPNNHDIPEEGEMISLDKDDYTEEEFAELMKEIEAMVEGRYEKEALTGVEEQQVQALQKSHATLKEVGDEIVGKAKCVVYKKLTEDLLNSPNFVFSSRSSSASLSDAITAGAAMGRKLSKRITVLAEDSTITYSHQDHGKIGKRLVHALGFDVKNVFEQKQIFKFDPILIHLSLDSSGSMSGEKWLQTMKLAAALAKVAEEISTIDLVISLRASSHALVEVLIAYDSRVDKFNKIVRLFPRLTADGGTPEGLAFDSIRDFIINQDKVRRKKYFINISDGEPSFSCTTPTGPMHYYGAPAFEHTRRRVDQMRQAGMTVLAYYIGQGSQTAFKEMYGKGAQFIDVGAVSDIARTLHLMMMEGERALDTTV